MASLRDTFMVLTGMGAVARKGPKAAVTRPGVQPSKRSVGLPVDLQDETSMTARQFSGNVCAFQDMVRAAGQQTAVDPPRRGEGTGQVGPATGGDSAVRMARMVNDGVPPAEQAPEGAKKKGKPLEDAMADFDTMVAASIDRKDVSRIK